MHSPTEQQPAKNQPSAARLTKQQQTNKPAIQHVDNRSETVAQKKLQQAISGNKQQAKFDSVPSLQLSTDGVAQLYTYNAGVTRTVTVTGNNGTNVHEECTSNSVEFSAGDKKPNTGTLTTAPAGWANWLTNKKGGRNATQLHVVNKRWGGLGGVGDKNIVPGTPAENSHHLHQAEKEFDKCFDGADKAINNCKYECTVTPKYGNAVDVRGGNVDHGDPTISVDITDNGVKTTHPVADGVDGLRFVDGS